MISKSPERHTFQRDGFLKRKAEEGKTPDNDESVRTMEEMYAKWNEVEEQNLIDPEWQKDNMEYDLRSTDWILQKVRTNDIYAQNLYASMCNREFMKAEVWPILKKQRWSCSWRHAGGIIADMRQEGDYIDWYCSGIRGEDAPDNGYVPEGHVTEEIREDLLNLGWIVLDEDSE